MRGGVGEPRVGMPRAAQTVRDVCAGMPLYDFPEDLRVYEHLLWATTPQVVIEIGAGGGSGSPGDGSVAVGSYVCGSKSASSSHQARTFSSGSATVTAGAMVGLEAG